MRHESGCTTYESDDAILRAIGAGASGYLLKAAPEAERLHLSEATVKTHLLTAFPKLDAKTRTGAVTRARELGLLGG